MGGRAARYDARGGPLNKLAALLLVGVALLAGCTAQQKRPPGPPSLQPLNLAVTGVTTARSALLDAVDATQAGARALDATDAICAQGHGVAARTSQREGAGAVSRAGSAVRNLPTLVANYRASLTALGKARTAVTGAPAQALAQVVTAGQTEAAAVAAFEQVVVSAWQQYVSLDGQERLWIKRAVTPWYRNDKEGADAYAVLVTPGRHFLGIARTQLTQASEAVRGPMEATSASFAAADRALSGLRSPG